MARSQKTFGKKEKEKKRKKKREDKLKKAAERKENSNKGGSLDSMLAYVDEFGNISDTPPDPTVKREEVDAESIELGVPKREEIVMDSVRKGKVEFFNDQKGFGFIKEDETQEKFFVHVHGCTEVIVENDKVSDDHSSRLSFEIYQKIQTDMTYTGQVKVTVIRETRAVNVAK